MTDPPVPNSPLDPQPAAAESVAPSPSPPNLNADITDELTDHLSLAARDLQLAGHPADEAQKLAHQKFGDLAAIRRRLFWIHQGDELMLRTALAIVCAVLVIAVAALGIGNWRMSRTIDDLHSTLATVSQNQKAITDAQKSILESQQQNRPLTIEGQLYVGDRSKPAAGAEVHLYRVSDRKLIDKYAATPTVDSLRLLWRRIDTFSSPRSWAPIRMSCPCPCSQTRPEDSDPACPLNVVLIRGLPSPFKLRP